MSKVILICGKICSGKSYYANKIKGKENTVILSTDEVTYDLTDNEQGESYEKFVNRVNAYLMKKTVELARIGCNVILDWGFWTKSNRQETADYFQSKNINIEWHYIDIDDDTWHKNIEYRNKKVLSGEGGSGFYVDEGLLNKVISGFEVPDKEEIDVWYKSVREEKDNSAKLRNMTSIYLLNNDKILLLYRQGSKVVNNVWIGSASGHFEEYELNDAKACVLRELKEEMSVTEEMLSDLQFRYITIRRTKGEIRQNYYFFANLKCDQRELTSGEGTLKWFELDEVLTLEMPYSAKYMMEHYLSIGRQNDKIYVGVADGSQVVFTELPEFS